MSRRTFYVVLVLVLAVSTVGCEQEPVDARSFRHLEPAPNRFAELSPLASEQPTRAKPGALAVSASGDTLFVALQGSIDRPGNEVLAVGLERREITRRYEVGRSPTGLALHPDGRHLVVTNRFSNFLSVIDLHTHEVAKHPVDFYGVEPVFSADGGRLFVSNRWRDSLQVFEAAVSGGALEFEAVRAPAGEHGVPVGANPRDVVVSADGRRIIVAAISGLSVTVIDAETLRPIGRSGQPEQLELGAPANDVAQVGDWIYVATLSASTHHPAFAGPDTDGDWVPGDGTPNVGFQDLQNELAVFRAADLEEVVRYTSDSLCCFDYRDVAPDDMLGEHLPPRSQWLVGGSLPERLLALEVGGEPYLFVLYSGSNELQRFSIGADGRLTAGPIIETGFNPMAIAANAARSELYVSNRLGESVSVVDLERFEVSQELVLGDVSGGEFPATDAEIGELYYFAGAAFSVDGDQTCNHCHRQRGSVAKAFSMPLLADVRGSRMTTDARGLLETRPWFFEGAMDENNFFPVINEFARAENFCCEDFDDHPDCATNPPQACSERGWPHKLATRDAFFRQVSEQTLARERSFGDAIDTRLDYLGMTRLLGLFLLREPALLPNPNAVDTPAVERGERLFFSSQTGCAGCHPPPGFAASFDYNPFDTPLRFGPLITPRRDREGKDLDLANPGFLRTFPMAEQEEHIRLKAPSLLGIWDRAGPFLHDGRAPTLREALATPDHPALGPGEVGYNERDGMPDTHGGTSSLSADELADLIAFLRTL